MKRFINIISVILVFTAVASASNLKSHGVTVGYGGPHCDPIEHLMGACRSSVPDFLFDSYKV